MMRASAGCAFALGLALVSIVSLVGGTEAVRTVAVEGDRVRLGNVVDVPAAWSQVDLGPSPALDGSRLLSPDDIRNAIPGAPTTGLRLPKAPLRIVRKVEVVGGDALESLARKAFDDATRKGVRLTWVRGPRSVRIPAGRDDVTLDVPRLPKRVGASSVVAMLRFVRGGEDLAKIPVTLGVDVSREGALAAVPRGRVLTVTLRRGDVEIVTSAVVSQDAEVGDVVPATLRPSGKAVRIRVDSRERGTVEP